MTEDKNLIINGGTADSLRVRIIRYTILTVLVLASAAVWFYAVTAQEGSLHQLLLPVLIMNGIAVAGNVIYAFFIGGYRDDGLSKYIVITFLIGAVLTFIYLCVTHPVLLAQPQSEGNTGAFGFLGGLLYAVIAIVMAACPSLLGCCIVYAVMAIFGKEEK